MLQSSAWVFAFADALTTSLLIYAPNSPATPLLCRHTPVSAAALTAPSVVLVVGVLSTVLGGILRKWCYDALGKLFTFERSIMPKHELITDGPYAWVRHPSYT